MSLAEIRKVFAIMIVLLSARSLLYSQVNDTISEEKVGRTIRYLASDSLKGRGNGRPELLKAALFIGGEFKQNKLQPLPGSSGYFLPFRPFGGSKDVTTDDLLWNEAKLSPSQFIYLHPAPGNYARRTLSDFSVVKFDGPFTGDILRQFDNDTSSLLLWTDKRQPDGKEIFPEVIKMPEGGLKRNILLVHSESAPQSLLLSGIDSYYSMLEYNVVSFLPGKSKANEVIIFSAHYDHEGVFGGRKDSILNGANDNASGTTALLALAHYFSLRNDNERTLMFCAFAGEELGLLGSTDFMSYINPDKLVAGINIEMIGVPEFGKNRVFIPGSQYGDLPFLLSKQLKRQGITVRSEPDESKQLFMRSDNYPFALKGVPYFTIMASDDDDKCYHQPCDEVSRIDIPNMTRIIRAIAGAVAVLISGQETPGRINPDAIKKPD